RRGYRWLVLRWRPAGAVLAIDQCGGREQTIPTPFSRREVIALCSISRCASVGNDSLGRGATARSPSQTSVPVLRQTAAEKRVVLAAAACPRRSPHAVEGDLHRRR